MPGMMDHQRGPKVSEGRHYLATPITRHALGGSRRGKRGCALGNGSGTARIERRRRGMPAGACHSGSRRQGIGKVLARPPSRRGIRIAPMPTGNMAGPPDAGPHLRSIMGFFLVRRGNDCSDGPKVHLAASNSGVPRGAGNGRPALVGSVDSRIHRPVP